MRLFIIRLSILASGFLLLTWSACSTKKNIVYFQGGFSGSAQNTGYNPVLKNDDLLSITVMGLDPDAVKPFNLPILTNSIQGGYSMGNPTPIGYLIGPDGSIDFPVVGKVKLAGLQRSEAVNILKEKLTQYLNNPIVIIRIINYKITVLGEVKNPGTFTIPNERITLPEAIGIAGDLLISAHRKNIKVIRETDQIKKEYLIDLTSKDLFSSPVYYLQQNDVIYVEPNRTKVNASLVNTANTGIAISALSVIITVFVLLTR